MKINVLNRKSKVCTQCLVFLSDENTYPSQIKLANYTCKKCFGMRTKFQLIRKPYLKHLHAIRRRCNNPNVDKYKNYGGRGIKCLLSIGDIKFLWFRDNADKLIRPSIDRFNADAHYELSNCHFIEQRRNTRKGRTGVKKQHNIVLK